MNKKKYKYAGKWNQTNIYYSRLMERYIYKK